MAERLSPPYEREDRLGTIRLHDCEGDHPPLRDGVCLLFIHPPAHGSEVSPAARNTLDSARIPRASKLLICGLFQKGRVLAQDGIEDLPPVQRQLLRMGPDNVQRIQAKLREIAVGFCLRLPAEG